MNFGDTKEFCLKYGTVLRCPALNWDRNNGEPFNARILEVTLLCQAAGKKARLKSEEDEDQGDVYDSAAELMLEILILSFFPLVLISIHLFALA